MSILNAQDKADLQSAFDEAIVETWERDIVVYKDAEKTIINTSPGDNPLFPESPHNASVETAVNKETIKARVKWGRRHTLEEMSEGGALGTTKAILQEGQVQIKVRKEHDSLFEGIKLAVVDGIEVIPDTPKRPHGLFDHVYSTFLFSRAN